MLYSTNETKCTRLGKASSASTSTSVVLQGARGQYFPFPFNYAPSGRREKVGGLSEMLGGIGILVSFVVAFNCVSPAPFRYNKLLLAATFWRVDLARSLVSFPFSIFHFPFASRTPHPLHLPVEGPLPARRLPLFWLSLKLPDPKTHFISMYPLLSLIHTHRFLYGNSVPHFGMQRKALAASIVSCGPILSRWCSPG